jgi:hypothetical protein
MNLVFQKSDVAIFNAKYFEHPCADKILYQNLETKFHSCPPRSVLQQVKQEKKIIVHISFDDINPSLFLLSSKNGRARLLVKTSAA